MYNIDKEKAIDKAEKVIASCVTSAHIDATSVYIDLFIDRFHDWVAYSELLSMLTKQKRSIQK